MLKPRPSPERLDDYAHCLRIAQSHYENFPVASHLLPKSIRLPIAAIYAYSRLADDLADEGNLSDTERLQQLDALQATLAETLQGQAHPDPILRATADSIQQFQLPLQPFNDLVDAFKQDVSVKRYANFGEVMHYCRRSANPVGRILLHLTGNDSEAQLAQSDAVCSALQLINFYQDLSQDYHELGRIYLPQDEMQRFGVTEQDIANAHSHSKVKQLLQFQYQRADQLLRSGAPLGKSLKGRFGLEIRLIIMGGARILYRLKQQDDLFSRPRLKPLDISWMIWGAIRKK